MFGQIDVEDERTISSSYFFAEILFSNLKNSDVNFLLFVWKYMFFNIAAHLFAFSPIFSSETQLRKSL
jgi:hypothetical protein